MRPFNIMAVVFLVLLGAFVAMTMGRMRLQDQRIEMIQDRLHSLEMGSACEDLILPRPVRAPEVL